MAAGKVNKYISLDSTSHSLPRYRKEFLNQHNKFIHASWCLREDIDRELELNDIKYVIFGLWDMAGGRYNIMLKPIEGGPYFIADSKIVANALGYTRMRNAVTGEEHKFDMIGKKYVVAIPSTPIVIDEDVEDEDEEKDLEDEDDDGFVDPLVKALEDDITDDGDTSNY